MAKQLSVFAENKPGSLEKIVGLLAKAEINMRALTISGSEGFGILKILVNKPIEAHDILTKNNIPAQIKDIIALYIDDEPGSLHKALKIFSRRGVNIIDSYGFIIDSGKKAIFVFEVDKPQDALKNLQNEKIKILSDSELYSI